MGDPSAMLLRRGRCSPLRRRLSWNATSASACVGQPLAAAETCEAGPTACQSRCGSLAWCTTSVCEVSRGCPCLCRVCAQSSIAPPWARGASSSGGDVAAGNVHGGAVQAWMRIEVLEYQTNHWLDYHSYQRDIFVP